MYREQEEGVLRLSDNASIPKVASNCDWKDYVKWVNEGNTPEPQFTTTELLLKAAQEAKKRVTAGFSLELSSGRCASGLGFDMDNRRSGDKNDQANIQTAIDLGMYDYLKDADGVTHFKDPGDPTVTYTQQEFEGVLLLMKQDGAAKMLKYHQKQLEIINASAIEEYNLIEW